MDLNIFLQVKYWQKILIKTRFRQTKRDTKIHRYRYTDASKKLNVPAGHNDIRWMSLFFSPQMTNIKIYLTAVYHGQLHFRCKRGLLSIMHQHHYAWHTVWHLTQVVTAQAPVTRDQPPYVGCRHHHLSCRHFHLSSALLTHTAQNSQSLHRKGPFFPSQPCSVSKYFSMTDKRPYTGSRVLYSLGKSGSNQFANYKIQTWYWRSFTQTNFLQQVLN